ncbi:MAG: polysaccharide lyase 6 family protein [Prevotellaceae bacterium]|nr:polysaccharide lyase 6 family protein [Prevotellaceae bacterium]
MKTIRHTLEFFGQPTRRLLLSACSLLVLLLAAASAGATRHFYAAAQYSALKSKLSSGLQAGDTVVAGNGVYPDFQVEFIANGTAANPIVFMAETPGQVIINGAGKMKLWMSGSFLEVNGFVFKNGWASNQDVIRFQTGSSAQAYNCRLTNCVVDSCNNTTLDKNSESPSERWVMLYGKNNRIDHCYFANKDRAGTLIMVDLSSNNSVENNHTIENNFFGRREAFPAGNGAETIRIGDSERSQRISQTIVRNNFFYRCDGEVEIISLKSCDNLIQHNTFYESAGMVVCRHGRRNTIDGNVFAGNNKNGCGGVRLINEGHKVYNNLFQELKGTGTRSALCVMTALYENGEAPLNAYHRTKDADVVFNTFVQCASIELGTIATYNGTKGTLPPQNIRIFNNIFYSMPNAPTTPSGANDSGITFAGNIADNAAAWTYNGITKKDIGMNRANGLFRLNPDATGYCIPPLNSAGAFSYVTTDATGSPRLNGNDVGAVNYENITKSYSATLADEWGVSWYSYPKP